MTTHRFMRMRAKQYLPILVFWTWLVAGKCLSAAADEKPLHIQAHRGGGVARAENTLEIFQWAWKMGVTPEADLRTTKDGVIVCFHDENFVRVVKYIDPARKKLGIEQLPLAEVQKLDVGSFRGSQFAGQRIPTLASVFSEMRGRPERLLYLDIKTVDLENLAELVREHDVESQVIFTTKDHWLIQVWKKLVPKSQTLLWNGGTEQELIDKMAAVRKANFDGITYLQIHVHVGDLASDEPFDPSSKFLRDVGKELKSRGIVFQTLPWECADVHAFEKLLELGSASFATDHPINTLQAVRNFREREKHDATK
jgi:glycerophosphoryl diester phosphodiesterase